MALRIGFIVVSPNGIFLVLGYLFFLHLSYARLCLHVVPTKERVWLSLALATVAGLVGSLLYGGFGSTDRPLDTGLPTFVSLNTGSFGGIWGAFAGAALAAVLQRQGAFRSLDALVPGVAVGAAAARVGGFFSGDSPGIIVRWLPAYLQLFQPWPVYDIAALMAALYFAVRARETLKSAPGLSFVMFLITYGVLRFLAEFIRSAAPVVVVFTWGHVMAAVQVAFGAAVAWSLLPRQGKH